MSLESDLQALLEAICPRVFADFAQLKTAKPYVTWQQIGGRAVTFVDNLVPSKENAYVQINVWSTTRSEAKTIAKQIESAMTTTTAFQARPVSAVVSDSDSDLHIYSTRQDFDCWANR